MDLLAYLDKRVRIVLPNNFYYIGKVVDCTEDDITLIDKTNKRVCLRKEMIMSILEVDNY